MTVSSPNSGDTMEIPKFYILVLQIIDTSSDPIKTLYFHFSGVAYSSEDAKMIAIEKMRQTQPVMFEAAKRFTPDVVLENEFTLERIEYMFQEQNIIREKKNIQEKQLKPLQMVVVPDIEEVSIKSKLMKQIVDEKSRQLLELHKETFNEYELAYLESKIC